MQEFPVAVQEFPVVVQEFAITVLEFPITVQDIPSDNKMATDSVFAVTFGTLFSFSRSGIE